MAAFLGIAEISSGRYLPGVLCLAVGAVVAAMVGLQLRVFVLLKPSALVMRTPMRTVELPWQQVVSARADRNYLVVLTADGRRIPVQGRTWADHSAEGRMFKVPSPSSEIATAINDAVRAARPEAAD